MTIFVNVIYEVRNGSRGARKLTDVLFVGDYFPFRPTIYNRADCLVILRSSRSD